MSAGEGPFDISLRIDDDDEALTIRFHVGTFWMAAFAVSVIVMAVLLVWWLLP